MGTKKKIPEIMDTTLRDGEQTHNVSFSGSEKLQLAKILLEKLNVDRIEVASALVSDAEKQNLKKIFSWAKKSKKDRKIEILGFVDHKRSVDWIIETGGSVMNLLTKGSKKHLETQIKKTPEQHFSDIEKTIGYASSRKVDVNVYLEDWSNGALHSPEYADQLIKHLSGLPVKRILLPDTLGVLYPTQVYNILSEITSKYPGIHFDFHPHNDYGLATINSFEAIRAGVSGIHTTVNCLGERTGNASLAEVVAGIHDHLGIKTSVQEKYLYLVSRMVETFSGKRLADNAPIVGEDVFTQTAGIHADGDKKGGLYESELKPGRFGRKRSYSLGKMAGKASLDHNLMALGIELSPENHAKVLKRVKELGDKKKIVTIDDLPFIISDVLKIPIDRNISLVNVVITSGMEITPICSLNLNYKNKTYKISGSGDGGYDAFMNAIRHWSRELKLELPLLKNYEVRIPPGGQTSALVECKITWIDKKGKEIYTRGVDPDQTIAAVQATERMLNIYLD